MCAQKRIWWRVYVTRVGYWLTPAAVITGQAMRHAHPDMRCKAQGKGDSDWSYAGENFTFMLRYIKGY